MLETHLQATLENLAGDSDVKDDGAWTGVAAAVVFFQVWSSIWTCHSKIWPDMLQGCGTATVISAVTTLLLGPKRDALWYQT